MRLKRLVSRSSTLRVVLALARQRDLVSPRTAAAFPDLFIDTAWHCMASFPLLGRDLGQVPDVHMPAHDFVASESDKLLLSILNPRKMPLLHRRGEQRPQKHGEGTRPDDTM